jgi:hypothetical protein
MTNNAYNLFNNNGLYIDYPVPMQATVGFNGAREKDFVSSGAYFPGME